MTDIELTAQIRNDLKTLTAEALAERDKKGYADPALLERLVSCETKLNEVCDKATAAVAAQTEMETKQRRFMEMHAPPPHAGGDVDQTKTLGQMFTESAEFKSGHANFAGRHARIATTLKSRMAPETKVVTEAGSGFVIPPRRIGIFSAPTAPLVMRDLWRVITLGPTNAIEYLKENWTYAADYQLTEGAKKPEGSVAWTPFTLPVRTIAWFVKFSRQMWMDVPSIQASIDDQLLYGIYKKEDYELLHGDNAAGHLWGILPQVATLPGTVLASNLMDEISKAIAVVEGNGYNATNIVMNPADWGAMQIQKNSQGFYVLGGPPASTGGKRLWGLPITTTPIMPARTVLVGQFPGTAAIYDREAATVDVAFENEDDFVKNIVCIRAEERLVFAVWAPQAYSKVVWPLVAEDAGARGGTPPAR